MYVCGWVSMYISFFFHGTTAPSGPRPPHYWGFTITLRHITPGRTPLDEWSARRRDLYLTTHNTHKGQTPMPPAGFEYEIIAIERPQTHVLVCGHWYCRLYVNINIYYIDWILYLTKGPPTAKTIHDFVYNTVQHTNCYGNETSQTLLFWDRWIRKWQKFSA